MNFVHCIHSANTVKPLDPWWVTGYTDGEGCFSIKFAKRKQIKIGWQVEPSFVIGLLRGIKLSHKRLKSYFGVGKI